MENREEDISPDNIEFEIRKIELKTKKAELSKLEQTITPINLFIILSTVTAIALALLAFLYGIILNSQNHQKSLALEELKHMNFIELERFKIQSQTMIEGVKTGDAAAAERNLRSFVNLGLLDDSDGRITAALDSGDIPILAAGASKIPPPGTILTLADLNGSTVGTAVGDLCPTKADLIGMVEIDPELFQASGIPDEADVTITNLLAPGKKITLKATQLLGFEDRPWPREECIIALNRANRVALGLPADLGDQDNVNRKGHRIRISVN